MQHNKFIALVSDKDGAHRLIDDVEETDQVLIIVKRPVHDHLDQMNALRIGDFSNETAVFMCESIKLYMLGMYNK